MAFFGKEQESKCLIFNACMPVINLRKNMHNISEVTYYIGTIQSQVVNPLRGMSILDVNRFMEHIRVMQVQGWLMLLPDAVPC